MEASPGFLIVFPISVLALVLKILHIEEVFGVGKEDHARTKTRFRAFCARVPTLTQHTHTHTYIHKQTHARIHANWFCGWTKSCTTWNPWLNPLLVGVFRGSSRNRFSEQWCEMDFATIHSMTRTVGFSDNPHLPKANRPFDLFPCLVHWPLTKVGVYTNRLINMSFTWDYHGGDQQR